MSKEKGPSGGGAPEAEDPSSGELREVFSPEERIAGVVSFEELYKVLRALGSIKGSRETYDPENVITYIERARQNPGLTDFVTRTYGIRSKVIKLLGVKD